MSENRTIKGKRPELFETPGIDYLMHMVMTLSQELSATRDRLDTLERVAEHKGLFGQNDIEGYVPTQTALEQRESRRQEFLSNMTSVMTQEAAQLAAKDTQERFNKVIGELAE